jgi:hypothetical protein
VGIVSVFELCIADKELVLFFWSLGMFWRLGLGMAMGMGMELQ